MSFAFTRGTAPRPDVHLVTLDSRLTTHDSHSLTHSLTHSFLTHSVSSFHVFFNFHSSPILFGSARLLLFFSFHFIFNHFAFSAPAFATAAVAFFHTCRFFSFLFLFSTFFFFTFPLLHPALFLTYQPSTTRLFFSLFLFHAHNA